MAGLFDRLLRRTPDPAPPAEETLILADGPRRAGEDAMYQNLGTSGNAFFRGMIQSAEYVSNLQGPTGATTYQKMRSDSQVNATEALVTLPIKSANWEIQAHTLPDTNGEREELPEVKAFLEEALTKRLNFDRLLDHMLLAWPFGYEVMEKVYENQDGRIWYKAIQHRRQSTIQQWHVKDGKLAGIEQHAWKDGTYKTIRIPAEPDPEMARLKLLHVAIEQEGDNFEGRSGLRSAYGPWYWKTELIKIALIGFERFGIGIPRGKIKKNWTSTLKTQIETLLEALRVGEKSHVIETEDVEIDILGQSSTSRYDPQSFINYCDESIAMSALAMALKLGTTQTGSRALGETLFQVFLLALEAIANQIATTADEQLIKPLLELNYGDADQIDAHLVWSDLKPDDVKSLAAALAMLTPQGHITKDPAIEEKLRKLLGLPPLPEEAADEEPEPDVTPAPEPEEEKPASFQDRRRALRMTEALDYWRPLRPEEKHLALKEIDGRQDDAQSQLVNYIAEDREAWAKTLRAQIVEALADGDPSDLNMIGIPAEERRRSANDVIGVQRDLHRFGRRMVKEELERQTKDANRQKKFGEMLLPDILTLRDDPLEDAELTKLFRVQTQAMLDGLAGRASSVALQRSMDLLRTRGTDFLDEDLDAIEEGIRTAFDAATRKASAPLVGVAFNQGRDKEARAQGVDRAIYSAILDDNTCEACLRFDGQEYQVGTPEYNADSPPNQQCESTAGGENACRCLWVYVMETEEAARG